MNQSGDGFIVEIPFETVDDGKQLREAAVTYTCLVTCHNRILQPIMRGHQLENAILYSGKAGFCCLSCGWAWSPTGGRQ
jgi:hypothetical protein